MNCHVAKPSTLIEKMLALLGDHPPCYLFLQLFLKCMPKDMPAQLIDARIDDCRQLARRANRIWEAKHVTNYMYAKNVQTGLAPAPEHVPPATSDIGLEDCIANTVQHCSYTLPKPKKRQPPSTPSLCYYHHTYDLQVRKCQQPCAWSGNKQAGRQ